jgi:hypothetical protein
MKNKNSRYLSNMQISEFEPILDGLQIKIGKTIYGSTITHKDDNFSKKCIKKLSWLYAI